MLVTSEGTFACSPALITNNIRVNIIPVAWVVINCRSAHCEIDSCGDFGPRWVLEKYAG